jgi:hypothetical protein
MNIKIAMVLTVVGIMTLCLVVTKPPANNAFAAATCNLTLKADPGSGSLAKGESEEQKLSGTLTCGGAALRGATITFSGLPPGMAAGAVTDSSGNFQGASFLVHAGDSFTPSAHYGGDSEHLGAAAGVLIKMSTK